MSALVAETRRLSAHAHAAERTDRRRLARPACALALMLAAGVHIGVGFDHAYSNFGALSFVAGLLQMALGAVLVLRPNWTVALSPILLTQLVLIQLYALNVTIGLPPQIGHSHVGGTHEVWLLTLAWPNVIDIQGVVAVVCEIVAIVSAIVLGRSKRGGTRA